MNRFCFIVGLFCLILAVACGPSVEERMRQAREKSSVIVDVPKSMSNAEDAPEIKNDSSKVVSLANRSYYVGSFEYPIEVLADKIRKNVAEAPNMPVYFQAAYSENYGEVVRVFDTIRKADTGTVGLLVYSEDRGPLRRLMINIPAEPKMEGPPEPDTVKVEFSKDGKLTIKGKDAGTPEQPDKFVEAIKAAPGKPVTIKGRRDTRYVDVVGLVNAAKGAGATPIILAIDDLN